MKLTNVAPEMLVSGTSIVIFFYTAFNISYTYFPSEVINMYVSSDINKNKAFYIKHLIICCFEPKSAPPNQESAPDISVDPYAFSRYEDHVSQCPK